MLSTPRRSILSLCVLGLVACESAPDGGEKKVNADLSGIVLEDDDMATQLGQAKSISKSEGEIHQEQARFLELAKAFEERTGKRLTGVQLDEKQAALLTTMLAEEEEEVLKVEEKEPEDKPEPEKLDKPLPDQPKKFSEEAVKKARGVGVALAITTLGGDGPGEVFSDLENRENRLGELFAMGMTTVVCEGSPLFPHAGRFASTIERHGVTLFKAGSTFLKAVMTDPASTRDMSAYGYGVTADRDLLCRTGVSCGTAVRHGEYLFPLHQLLLGNGARRHRVLLPLRWLQGPAARCQDLGTALGSG